MKILFLDIDGVLNSAEYMFFNEEDWNSEDDAGMIDSDAVLLVNKIIEETGAKIVISSTWRINHELSSLRDILKRKGFIGDIIDRTPDGFWIDKENHIYSERGHEIQKWIRAEPRQIESFVILDDDADMVHLAPFLVKTTWERGILQEHVVKAIEILNKKDNT